MHTIFDKRIRGKRVQVTFSRVRRPRFFHRLDAGKFHIRDFGPIRFVWVG